MSEVVVKDKTPLQIDACMYLTFSIDLNGMFFLILISKIDVIKLPERNLFISIVLIFVFMLIYYILYFSLVKGGKYLKIIERFSKETESQRVKGNWLVLFYSIATYASFILFYYI